MIPSAARLFTLSIVLAFLGAEVLYAQAPPKASSCDPEKALILIEEQLEGVSMHDPKSMRVELYHQGAALLWKHRQQRARVVFQAAYDWAREVEAEKREAAKAGKKVPSVPGDIRVDVIRAIGRYDQEWSRKLMDELLADKEEAGEKPGEPGTESGIGDAIDLLEVDPASALKLARQALASARGREVAGFAVALARRDRAAADAFYLEALAAISQRSINETMMLYTYPFASVRPIGVEWRSAGVWRAGEIAPNPALQLRYLETLLQLGAYHAQQPLVTKAPREGPFLLSPAARLYLGLLDLEAVIASHFPALQAKFLQIKERLPEVISDEYMNTVQTLTKAKAEASVPFDRNLREDEIRRKYPNSPEMYYLDSIREGITTEPQERLEKLADKFSDLSTRKQVADWLYYNLVQRALKESRPDDAMSLMEKISPLDLRAAVAYQIAESVLNKAKDSPRASDSLNSAWRIAKDADDTNEKAKALLGIASLYLRMDSAQALNALRAAVRTINQIKSPDVSSGNFTQMIRGKGFASYVSYSVPGMSLPHAFREAGRADYEAALSAAFGLDDAALRAQAVFALSAFCLEKGKASEAPRKPKTDKK